MPKSDSRAPSLAVAPMTVATIAPYAITAAVAFAIGVVCALFILTARDI
jgi:hypothetical protein